MSRRLFSLPRADRAAQVLGTVSGFAAAAASFGAGPVNLAGRLITVGIGAVLGALTVVDLQAWLRTRRSEEGQKP